MQNIIAKRTSALLITTALLGGCANSQFNGYVTAGAEDAKIVNAGGYSKNATAQIAIVQNPDFNGGKISFKALRTIQRYSMSCQGQIDAQAAGAGQSGINGAVPYGMAGAGTGPAAAAAFAGASAGSYATYGALAYVLPGAVNGLVTGSYALASAKGSCTRDFWEDVVHSDPDFAGTHVEVLYAGKNWGDSAPPALDRGSAQQAAANR
jgi:hypothetical protein